MSYRIGIGATALAFLAACSGAGPGEAQQAAATASGGSGGAEAANLVVMTRNLYLGADIRRIAAAATPRDLPLAAADMWRVVQESDFPARAQAIADEIEASAPDLVALQEVSLYRTGPPNACAGKQVAATEVAIDFLALLQDALVARGLEYAVAQELENFDAQLCVAVGAETAIDVRLTDRDVILARSGLATSNPRSGHFTARADFPAGGAALPVPRGWATVDVASPIGELRFAATHLEVEASPDVQAAQAAELVSAVADGLDGKPVVLAGDLNAGPELASVTTTYDDLLAAGYADPWPGLRRDAGPTCCFAEDLASGTLTQRIDLTLYQGALAPRASARTGLRKAAAGGTLYPSDHAGVVTVFAARSACEDEDDDCPCECACGGDHDDDGCDDDDGCEHGGGDREHHDCGLHLGQWCDEEHRRCGLDLGELCDRDAKDCGLHLGQACHEDRRDCGLHLGQRCDGDREERCEGRGRECRDECSDRCRERKCGNERRGERGEGERCPEGSEKGR